MRLSGNLVSVKHYFSRDSHSIASVGKKHGVPSAAILASSTQPARKSVQESSEVVSNHQEMSEEQG
jgi:hypothetical protein